MSLGLSKFQLGFDDSSAAAASPFDLAIAKAFAWYDAKTMTSTADQTIVNSRNGAAGTATRGSTGGVDANDPGFVMPAGGDAGYWDHQTSDYIQLPASDLPTFTALTGIYTALMCVAVDTVDTFRRFYSAEAGANNGLQITTWTGSAGGYVGGSGINVQVNTGGATPTDGTKFCVAVQVQNGTVRAYDNINKFGEDKSLAAVGTIGFGSAPRIGAASYSGGAAVDAHIFSVVLFNDAPTETELDDLSATLISGDYTP